MSIRVIPRLDIKGPNLVKGVHFEELAYCGKAGVVCAPLLRERRGAKYLQIGLKYKYDMHPLTVTWPRS